jgi:hypothetical protein
MCEPTKSLIAAFSLLLLFALFCHADSARFYRILKLYSDPTYRASDRKLFMTGTYDSKSSDSVPKEQGMLQENDEMSVFKRTATHDLGAKGVWLKGDARQTMRDSVRIGLAGNYSCSSSVRSNAIIDRKDVKQTLKVSEDLSVDLSRTLEKYFSIRNNKFWFFGLEAESKADLSGFYGRNFDDEKLSYSYATMTKYKYVDLEEHIWIKPSIGWGKPAFVTPIYRAFEIERALKDAGALKGALSDSTMVRIAQWLASEFSVIETKDRPRKYIFAALDTILCTDSAIIKSPQTAYTLMNVVEKHDNTFPFLFNGIKVSLFATIAYNGRYEYGNYYSSSFEIQNGPQEFYSEYEIEFPALNLEWGKALSPHFFFLLNIETSTLFQSYSDLPWFDKDRLQVTSGLSLYYLVNDRLYLDAGFTGLTARFGERLRQPDTLLLSARYFIEQHIALELTLTHGHGYSDDSWPNRYKSIEMIADHLNLELFYDF